jgi:hypothetical protein
MVKRKCFSKENKAGVCVRMENKKDAQDQPTTGNGTELDCVVSANDIAGFCSKHISAVSH